MSTKNNFPEREFVFHVYTRGNTTENLYIVIYPLTWLANLVGDILLFLVYSYDRRLIRNTTLLLVDMGSILYRRYDGLQ